MLHGSATSRTEPVQNQLPVDDWRQDTEARHSTRFLAAAMLGTVAGGFFALLATALSVYAMDSYGGSLFIGMPIVAGTVAGFVYNQPCMRGIGASMLVGMLSVAIGGLFLLLFAMEGVICLVMAIPIVLPLGMLGGFLGYALARMILLQSKLMLSEALVLALPTFALIEKSFDSHPIYLVESSVDIAASAQEVWENVISFPEINKEPDWYFFQHGIAVPLRARIEGQGVAAVRHCEFFNG